MLLVAVAVALPYPQDAAAPAVPAAAVPGADGLTADLRHHHGHNSGGYGAGYNQGYGGYNQGYGGHNQGYGGYNQQGYGGYNQGYGNNYNSKYQN
jgi:hypothetical protein